MATNARAPYQRRMTEKRRLQNRAAQKNYREKQKNRIAQLERIASLKVSPAALEASSFSNINGNEQLSSNSHVNTEDLSAPESDETQIIYQDHDGLNTNSDLGSLGSNIRDNYSSFMESRDFPIDGDWGNSLGIDSTQNLAQYMQFPLGEQQTSTLARPSHSTGMTSHVEITQSPFRLDPLETSVNMMSPFQEISGRGFPYENSSHKTPASFAYAEPLQSSSTLLPVQSIGIGGHSNPSQYGLVWETLRYIIQMNVAEDPKNLLRLAMECNLNLASVMLHGLNTISNRKQFNMGDLVVRGLRATSNGRSSGVPSYFHSSGLADPYTNNLQMLQASTIDAYLCNARAIGLSEEDFYHDHCSSPFYRADVTSVEDLKSYQVTLSENIAPHLRPTPEQILHQHHPTLDILPFPSMRSRAVSLLSFTPPLLDLIDLKRDISKDGLICWHADKTGNGNPRDMRSWEAAPWFLKKWWMLLGGKEGEAFEQTKWWREFRGESTTILFPD